MHLVHILQYFVLFLVLEICYFRIADYFNIIDKPNYRSSHQSITLRGGGIIFSVAVLLYVSINGFPYVYFAIGLFLISLISFLDDIVTLNNKVRLGVHLLSTLLLYVELGLFHLPWYWLVLSFVFIIATINAYNFMDGINGMTGGYSLLTIASLCYINEYVVVNFTSTPLLIVIFLSLLVFNIFNFRAKAKCFAGDVGSISMAYIIIFLIGSLILETGNIAYILLLLCYGIDTAFTVLFRKIRRENIFEAHRSHFYQFLSNQLKFSHIKVSLFYVMVQLLINLILIKFIGDALTYQLILLVLFCIVYLAFRFKLEGKKKLLSEYDSN